MGVSVTDMDTIMHKMLFVTLVYILRELIDAFPDGKLFNVGFLSEAILSEIFQNLRDNHLF